MGRKKLSNMSIDEKIGYYEGEVKKLNDALKAKKSILGKLKDEKKAEEMETVTREFMTEFLKSGKTKDDLMAFLKS